MKEGKLTEEKIGCNSVVQVLVNACSTKSKHRKNFEHENHIEPWPELEAFHTVMAKVFHPYKDSGDLKPVQMYSGALLQAARKWVSAPLPQRVRNQTMEMLLQKLSLEAGILDEKVKNGNENEIKSSLEKTHATFHEIMEVWYDEKSNSESQ